MTSIPGDQEKIGNTTQTLQQFTTMPSYVGVRNPMSRMHPPYPRPTVSLDPRPVVIPILSSVIGFPIFVFVLICALRHRAIKLRRKDHLKKLQSGIRSVTLDLPPREKVSYFSGGSSPDISMREVGDKPESILPSCSNLKSSLHNSGLKRSSSRNNNHVKFVTPETSMDVSNTLQVDVILHSIERLNGSPWRKGESAIPETIEGGVEVHPDPRTSIR